MSVSKIVNGNFEVLDASKIEVKTVPEPSAELDQRAWQIAKTDGSAEMIQMWGYGCEKHNVETSDGVILTVFRVLPAVGTEAPVQKPTVLFWPGFGQSSNCFVCAPQKEANAALVFVEAGLDVWLGNPRGPIYTDFKDAGREYSMDDIAQKDIPAVVDYVLASCGKRQLSFVGISQGTTSVFGALSLFEDMNTKINPVIALAPTLKPNAFSLREFVWPLFKSVGINLDNRFFISAPIFLSRFIPASVSAKLLMFIVGISVNRFDFARMGSPARQIALMSHAYHGVSKRVIHHWCQTFQEVASFSHYKPSTSAFDQTSHSTFIKYPTKHITCRIVVIFSPFDPITDLQHLQMYLPSNTDFIAIQNYAHFEFLWGLNAYSVIFKKAIDIVYKYNGRA